MEVKAEKTHFYLEISKKLLLSNFLFYCVIFLFVLKISTVLVSINFPQNIFFADVTKSALENFVNQTRQSVGLSMLSENQKLNQAAQLKAENMTQNNYFAHTSPSGISPWFWFSKAGYNYKYAGENLARDFSSAQATVDAWMNSPTHRDNILNSKYKEIGIGVTEGDLAGIDTTIVVQFFGATYQDKVSEPVAQVQQVKTPVPTLAPTIVPVTTNLPQVQAEITSPQPNQQVLISPFNTTRFASIAVVLLLLFVFVLDAFLVSRRRIIRVAGRTFAHVAFLGMILTVILILRSGKIL